MAAAKIIDVDFREVKAKRIKTNIANKIYNAKYRARKAFKWCITHPVEVGLITTASAGVWKFGRMVVRDIKPTTQDRLMKRQRFAQYDNQLNIWWDLKHEMTNAEKIEFESRRRSGESVAEALRNMNIMKK